MKEMAIKRQVYEIGDIIEIKGENLPNIIKRKSFDMVKRALVMNVQIKDMQIKYKVVFNTLEKATLTLERQDDVKYIGSVNIKELFET